MNRLKLACSLSSPTRALDLAIEIDAPDGTPLDKLDHLYAEVRKLVVTRLGQALAEAKAVAPEPSPSLANGNDVAHRTTSGGEPGISPKQKGFLLGLGAKQGLKIADLNQRAKVRFGADATVHNLTRHEASELIEELKADSPTAKGA